MYTDLLSRDLHKYDLSSVEAGKRLKKSSLVGFIQFGVKYCLCFRAHGRLSMPPRDPEATHIKHEHERNNGEHLIFNA